ncbi:protein kinase vwkA [Seminavis robusta]|uniref:Protein kinase vwkA n=1 Tax=Seminavis robusta TaxID=568900 RepID=A0A9N8H2J6_9STRA|nr:protein kinase vwkA [Seminavis robusta]|eukprot:Sro66_g037350.1 protein kinase vwkA (635) ;mRNA; f:126745-128649
MSSSFSVLDLDDGWASVDAWESPDIVSAALAFEAEKDAAKLERKLELENNTHERLAEEVRGHMAEMASMLKKVESSTATRREMERLSDLDKEMKRLKADLTATKSAIKSYTEEMLKSKSTAKTYALMKTVKDRDIRSVMRFIKDAETVDLAFLLDCTGSMGPHIEAAKSCIKEIVRRVKRTNEGLKLRVAVIGYRDIYNRDERFETLDFTESSEEFERFVSALSPIGNDDPPEDIAGAVQKACTLSWQQTSRITFLIADFPCHGSQYHNYLRDNYPSGTPGVCIEAQLKRLMSLGGEAGMQLHFGRITKNTDKMIRVLQTKGFEFDECDVKDPGKLTSSVASSVRKSISKSVTASKSKSGAHREPETLMEYVICDAKPSGEAWKSLKLCPVKVLCNKPISSVNELKNPLHFGLVRWGKSPSTEAEEKMVLMRRAKDPFAQGEMRLAYYGKLGMDEASLMSTKGDKILKTFKKTGKSSSERKRYLAQMEVSNIAHFLAEEYNKTHRPDHCPKIRFLSVYVVEESETGTERYCAEDQLPGAATSFTKYSNNTGYWNEDEINQSLLLFTRFTHEKTGGYLMVTDLQGVRQGDEFILTDPAILCKDKTRFGETNLGHVIIEKCMKATEAMLEEYGWDD